MKKDSYNQFTKSDMPLDTSLDLPAEQKTTAKTAKKPTINAIGSAKKAKSSKIDENIETKTNLRKKLSSKAADFEDLEKLNEENIKSHKFRGRRNQVIIILLSILLVVTIAAIAIFLVVTRVEPNCFMYVDGASATYFIDGKQTNEFAAPANTTGNRILHVDISINIHSTETYNVSYSFKCYNKDVLLTNILIYEPNRNLFAFDSVTNSYISKEPITGGKTIQLCQGLILDREYENKLNGDDFKFEFFTHFEKV